jgi:hypothetical protein
MFPTPFLGLESEEDAAAPSPFDAESSEEGVELAAALSPFDGAACPDAPDGAALGCELAGIDPPQPSATTRMAAHPSQESTCVAAVFRSIMS